MNDNDTVDVGAISLKYLKQVTVELNMSIRDGLYFHSNGCNHVGVSTSVVIEDMDTVGTLLYQIKRMVEQYHIVDGIGLSESHYEQHLSTFKLFKEALTAKWLYESLEFQCSPIHEVENLFRVGDDIIIDLNCGIVLTPISKDD